MYSLSVHALHTNESNMLSVQAVLESFAPSSITYIDQKSTANAVMFIFGWSASRTFQLPVPEFMAFIRSRFQHSDQKKAGWPLFHFDNYKMGNQWSHIHGDMQTTTNSKQKTSKKNDSKKKKKALSFKVDPTTMQLFGDRKCYISITEIADLRVYDKVKYEMIDYNKGILVKMSGGNKMPFIMEIGDDAPNDANTDSNINTNGKEEASDDEDDAAIDTDTNTTTTMTSNATMPSPATMTTSTSTTSTTTTTKTKTKKDKKYRMRYKSDSFRRDERSWNEFMKDMTANIAAMQSLDGLQCYDDYWIEYLVYFLFLKSMR